MKYRGTRILALLLGLLGLQQLLSGLWRLEIMTKQSMILKHDDIEPAALFYTDCPQARKAERILRDRCAESGISNSAKSIKRF